MSQQTEVYSRVRGFLRDVLKRNPTNLEMEDALRFLCDREQKRLEDLKPTLYFRSVLANYSDRYLASQVKAVARSL